ncbi:M13-type metalloendopeptidase [Phenylobacterium sp.]|uniref:M13 family metallopeptidase n=1 Tax=Phenylobacterium sp. TaxID=1871053 RepID=UPI00121E7A34|nr:M13-type metalloendopeptidase [Phenylobacterium sp.]THD61880.1 MAG: M13 family peptidase [Phenylobacterium sp.]
MSKSAAALAVILTLTAGAARAAEPAALKYGAWGVDLTAQDPKTRPGDDFFRYANGAWLDRTPIPADKPAVSLRTYESDLAEARLHAIMEDAAAKAGHAPTDVEGKVGAFYRAFMDEGRVEALGATPIAPQLAAIRAATTREQLGALMGRQVKDFESGAFGIGLDVDAKDISHYAIFLAQAGLGLPDRDYYLQSAFAEKKAAYQAYVETLLTLEGWPDAKAKAAAIVALETRIAEASWTKAEERNPDTTYNPYSLPQLEAAAPGFPWRAFLAAADLGSPAKVVVVEKTAFPKIAAIYGAAPVDVLQAWLAFNVADNAAPYLSKPFDDAFFAFRKKTLTGQDEEEVRWKRGVHAVSGGDFAAGDRSDRFGTLGWAVGQLYTARYFPPAAKAKVQALVADLKTAYAARIGKLDWMSPATKTEALKKLAAYTVKVGYPDKPRDYSKVVIRDDDLVGDVLRAAQADWAFYVARQNGPVDRGDWGMTPQTNDAYNGSLIDIVFPAVILQPPIFDPGADPAVNYGAVGGVIGHELTHGFDDQGRKYDSQGRLRDWWAPADAKIFEARAKAFGAQYSAYEPLPGAHVNGDLTMGENIADLGGLTLGLDAYHASLHGKPAPVIDGLTGDQRVFLGWAQAWRGKLRDDAVRRQVVSDPHSPRQYRVNGPVRNIDAWYAAFGVKPGDKLYIAPDQRVRIW